MNIIQIDLDALTENISAFIKQYIIEDTTTNTVESTIYVANLSSTEEYVTDGYTQ